MRPGDVGDDAGRMPRRRRRRPLPAEETPIDLEAVRADDDLVEALAAGLVPPPTRLSESDDVDDQLVALLASWVADVRPETLLHRLTDAPIGEVTASAEAPGSDEPVTDITSILPTVAAITAEVGNPAGGGPVPTGAHAEQVERADEVTFDAGITADASSAIDAGITADAGTAIDAGVTADAGTAIDAGVAADAGSEAPTVAIPLVVAVVPQRGRWRPARIVVPRLAVQRLAAAALLTVLLGSSLTVGAWEAKPGTTLWPMTRVVFAEKARSVQAATDVTTNLARARIALNAHQPYEAVAAYQAALTQLLAVAPAEGRAALAQESNQIGQQLGLTAPAASTDSSTGDNGAPAVANHHVLASGSAGAAIDIASAPAAPAGSNNPVLAAGATAELAAATGTAADGGAPDGAAVAAPATGVPATALAAAGSPAGGGAVAAVPGSGAATGGGNAAGGTVGDSGVTVGTGTDGGTGSGDAAGGGSSSTTADPPTDDPVTVAPTTEPSVDPSTDTPPPTSSAPSSTDSGPTDDNPADSSDDTPSDSAAATGSASSGGGDSTDTTDGSAGSAITATVEASA